MIPAELEVLLYGDVKGIHRQVYNSITDNKEKQNRQFNMPRNNRNKSNTKRVKRVNKTSKKTNPRNKMRVSVTPYCAVTNPFCQAAAGSKNPLGHGHPTVSYSIKNVFQAFTGAGGALYLVLRGSESSASLRIQAPAVGTDFPATTTYATMGSHPALISQTRLVSAGIRWWPVYPDSVSGGIVSVVPLDDDTALLDGNIHTMTDIINTPGTVHTSLAEPGSYILPYDKTIGGDFKDATANTALLDNSHSAVVLAIQGTGLVGYVFVELAFNYEGTVDVGQSLQIGSPPQHAPMVQRFMDKPHAWSGFTAGGMEKIEKVVKEKAGKWLRRAAEETAAGALSAAANFFVPGAGAPTFMALNNVIEVVD
jgi:hypothetical protein